MKKIAVLFLTILLLIVFMGCESGNDYGSYYVTINGDIAGLTKEIKLSGIESVEHPKLKEIKEKSKKAYLLSTVLKEVEILNENSYIMFTSSDKVSATIDISTANLCYLLAYGGSLYIDAPMHPPVASIKDIFEITVISKDENVSQGINIVSENGTEILSNGNSKLMFFDQVSHNLKNGNVAYKYMPNSQKVFLSDIVSTDDNYIYGTNLDIHKTIDNQGSLFWNGALGYQDQNKKVNAILGIVTGVSQIVYDAYDIMKTELDAGNKVMFILPDGLSYEQVTHYSDDLSLLGGNYDKATTVHPAISNVALASIITGESPYRTGITERGIKKPALNDIFDYALDLGKTAKYIEGSGNLVITDIEPIYNTPNPDGYTDQNVFNTAMEELEKTPDLIFVHFHGIDDVNHEYSPISNQAKAKILETENYIEQLMQNFDGTVIIVPDHGAITYTDNEGNIKGKHGYFQNEDMYVPFYVIRQK